MDPLRFWPQNHNASEDEKTEEYFHIAATLAADGKMKVVVNGTDRWRYNPHAYVATY
jgi:hypothetical protein